VIDDGAALAKTSPYRNLKSFELPTNSDRRRTVISFMSITTLRANRGLFHWIKELDRILRGEITSLSSIRKGMLELPVGGLAVLLVGLAAIYGFCMGWFGMFNRTVGGVEAGLMQLGASMIKVPALFLLTLLVTFPSLYVFNALVGSRLTFRSLTRLMVAAMAVMMAVLASFGPIVAFFSVTTTSHPFILLMNVLFCGAAGLLGMAFLLQTLHRLTIVAAAKEVDLTPPPLDAQPIVPASHAFDASGHVELAGGDPTDRPAPIDEPAVDGSRYRSDSVDDGPLDNSTGHVLGAHVKTVFRCWVVAFALVGTQMSWVLRPFIGKLDEPFTLFSPRESSFFHAVWTAFQSLF